MLEAIHLEKSNNTPLVRFDPENNIFEIRGRSIPEDATKYYLPIMLWLEKYISDPLDYTEFVVDLEYFNSSSAKRLMRILSMLEGIADKGKQIKILWLFQEGDELIEERGIEIQESLKIPFELKSY